MSIDSIIEDILSQITANFDFGYMLTINVLTYLVIKILDEINGNKVITTWHKRIVLLVSAAIVAVTYKLGSYDNNIVLINSTIFAPVFWSWVLKPVLTKFGIGYKKVDDCLS